MALNLVTARARTRGRSGKEFTYQAVGRLKSRKVLDKNGNPLLVDSEGKEVKYDLIKNAKGKDVPPFEVDSNDEYIAPEGTRFIEVDDVETFGLTSNLQEVLDLAGALSDDDRGYVSTKDEAGNTVKTPKSVLDCVISWSLDGFNYLNQKNAAPVTEQVTDDELTPITSALVSFKVFVDGPEKDDKGNIVSAETKATTWRRNITSGAKLMEVDRMAFVKSSPQYKKLLAAGFKEEAA